ncbi:MAG TPA: hypothetical protein VD908_07180 [Cytophagales bacterium]|nr:hypothetical protein [Cytophagales bacterium]
MPYLSQKQTEFILMDIRQRGITMPELEVDLLDFLCSSVEQEMENQPDFESAYLIVLKTLKPNELKMTQQNIRDLLENRVSLLEKVTYLTLFALLSGIAGYLLFIPFAGALISISELCLIGLYIYSNVRWYFNPDGKSKSQKAFILAAVFIIFLFIISIIFKLYHWPGAGYLMVISLSILIFLPIIISLMFFIKADKAAAHVLIDIIKKNHKKAELILFIFLFMGFCARMLLINFLGNIFIITTLFCFAILFISYTWPVFTTPNHKGRRILLWIVSSVAYSLALITGLFKIMQWPFPLINFSVNLPYILLGLMACIWYGVEASRKRNSQSIILLLLSLILFVYSLLLYRQISTFPFLESSVYNLPILILFVVVLVAFYKHQLFRVVAISLLGYYLLAFPYSQMPNKSLVNSVYANDKVFLELYEKSYQNPQNEAYMKQLLEYNENKMVPQN